MKTSRRIIINELKKLATDLEEPSSFTSTRQIKKSIQNSKVSTKFIEEYLKELPSFTLHKPVRRKFKRTLTKVYGVDIQHQADLIEFIKYAKFNSNYKYALIIVDVLSRFLMGIPLINKKPESVVKGFKEIYKNGRSPKIIQTDDGSEFIARSTQAYFKSKNIRHFTTSSDTKSALVERAIRTLKNRLYKYFTHSKTLRWYDVIQKHISNYNRTIHSVTKIAPVNVTKENEGLVWVNSYKSLFRIKKNSPFFKPDDEVRLTHLRKPFKKGFLPGWTKEIFVIHEVRKTIPITYKVKDKSGEILKGIFYKEELLKVNNVQ